MKRIDLHMLLPAARNRNPEQGNAMVLAIIAMTSLVALGGLTVISVKGGLAATGQDRFNASALYAAESGATVAMDYLRTNVDPAGKWSAMVSPSNVSPPILSDIPGNGILPGEPGNLFTAPSIWYEVQILNNRSDPNFANIAQPDSDLRVTIRSTGHGPDGAVATVEWDVAASSFSTQIARPCPGYGQKGMSEDGSGRNDCMSNVVSTDKETYTPGS